LSRAQSKDDRFWYRKVLRRRIDADNPGRSLEKDADHLRAGDSGLPRSQRITTPRPRPGRGGRGVAFAANAAASASQGRPTVSSDGKPLAISPDGNRGAFVRDWNLWMRDMRTGRRRRSTTDGITYFGYATDNAGWSSSDRAILLWSPDSKKIATQQQDERNVGEMYLVSTTVGHPDAARLEVSAARRSGDGDVASCGYRCKHGRDHAPEDGADFHRATLGDNISMNDYNWSPDGRQLALASVSREHKTRMAARCGHRDRCR
jgi:hypothetical protein